LQGNDALIATIGKMVREHLTRVLGNSTVQVIDSWLKQRGYKGIEDICVDPEKVSMYLYIIFKDAAILLENEIARALEDAINNSSKDSEFIKDIVVKIRSYNKKVARI
jgi:hypothetical protein